FLRLLRQDGECIAGRRRIVVPFLVSQGFEQLVAEALRRFEETDSAVARAEVSKLSRLCNRFRHSAESVDQSNLMGRSTVPDAALSNLVDVSRGLVPRSTDNAEETCVHRVDARLDQLVRLGRGAFEQVRFAREWRGFYAIGPNAKLLQCSLEAGNDS